MIVSRVSTFDNFMSGAEVSIRVAAELARHPNEQNPISVNTGSIVKKDKHGIEDVLCIGSIAGDSSLKMEDIQVINAKSNSFIAKLKSNFRIIEISTKSRKPCLVAAPLMNRKLLVHCRGGFLGEDSDRGTDYATLRAAIGQISVLDMLDDDVVALALPASNSFRELVSQIQNQMLIRKIGLRFVFVSRGKVEGLSWTQECLR